MNIQQIVPNKNCVLINEINVNSDILTNNRKYIRGVKYWHKFIVSNTDKVPRNELLQIILDHIYPLDLIPVYFMKDPMNSNSYFMARNCEAAIEKLCSSNLIIEPPNNNNSKFHRPFKISIVLNFATIDDIKIDVQQNVVNVLRKRYGKKTNTLDLTQFLEDEDLEEFCPLSQPKVMYFVLHLAKNMNIRSLILAKNNIKSLSALEVFSEQGSILQLDLSDNRIDSIESLNILKHFKLHELVLSYNPICGEMSEIEYIKSITSICPHLFKLDGVVLPKLDKLPNPKRNFLCNINSTHLVNQFVEWYFTIYDSRNKEKLDLAYHKNSLFSLTTTYHDKQISSNTAFLKTYHSFSRNLHKSSDVSKTSQFLYNGRDKIVELLLKLPRTDHDPYSFCVDLIYETPTCAIIVVHGVFRELSQAFLAQDQYYGFTRSFALEINSVRECSIVNEQWHIYNALSFQQVKSFTVEKPVKLDKPLALKAKDRQEAVRTIKAITNLKLEWARKCLEQCDYDLKKSLDLFVDLYKNDKFPDEAFVGNTYEKEIFGRFMCDADGNIVAEESIETLVNWVIPTTEMQFQNLNKIDNNNVIFKWQEYSKPKVTSLFKSMIKTYIASNKN